MKKILYEVIYEASKGNVIIDDEIYFCSFNTITNDIQLINENNLSTLVIKNEDKLLTLLEEYITLELNINRKFYEINNNKYRNKIKALITFLFVNATPEEFIDPLNMLKRKIAFIKDKTFDKFEECNTINTKDIILKKIKIKKQNNSIMMETPYKLTISITNENNIEFPLAEISYGIINNTCYIYSIMKPKEKKDLSIEEKLFHKTINRYLYKLNKGILEQETKEFIEYKEHLIDYYPENITDVTQSFVLALTIFESLLQKENINTIKIVPFLPLRYLSRQIAANNIKDEIQKNELLKRNDRIQENATNKFIRTFRRVDYHYGSSSTILSYPYMQDEYMTISLLNKQEPLNNPILETINEAILNQEIYEHII